MTVISFDLGLSKFELYQVYGNRNISSAIELYNICNKSTTVFSILKIFIKYLLPPEFFFFKFRGNHKKKQKS